MPITIHKKPASVIEAPPQAEASLLSPAYTILDALRESVTSKKTLMLVHKATGVGYQVIRFDPQDGKTRLKNEHGALLNVRITEREVAFYSPVWRG